MNRVIDVEWMLHNEEYAREVLRIARKQGLAELSQYAERMEELILAKAVLERAAPVLQDAKKKSSADKDVEEDADF